MELQDFLMNKINEENEKLSLSIEEVTIEIEDHDEDNLTNSIKGSLSNITSKEDRESELIERLDEPVRQIYEGLKSKNMTFGELRDIYLNNPDLYSAPFESEYEINLLNSQLQEKYLLSAYQDTIERFSSRAFRKLNDIERDRKSWFLLSLSDYEEIKSVVKKTEEISSEEDDIFF